MTECNYTLIQISSSNNSNSNKSVINGEYKKYNREDGELLELIEYDKGVMCGKKYEYLDGVNLKIESYYTDDKLNGKYKKYSRYGLIKECEYKDGKLEGEYKEYLYDDLRTGKMVLYIHNWYKDGKRDGGCITNYQFIDSPWTKTWYKDGKCNGSFIKYFDPTKYNVTSPHKIMCETNYKEDKLDGLHKEYFEDGSLFKEINYVDGKIHGKYKEYKKGGVLYLECDHYEGKKYGYLIDHINKQRGLFVDDIQVG